MRSTATSTLASPAREPSASLSAPSFRACGHLTESGFPNQGRSDSASMLVKKPAWMTALYSMDLRERALVRKGAGETNRENAAALRISPSYVSRSPPGAVHVPLDLRTT